MASQHSHTTSASKPEQSGSRSKDQDKGLVDKATDTVRSAADQATEFAGRAMEQGREAAAMAKKAPGAMREAVDSSLKQQPMATLAIAGALGFLLGALWKS